MTKRTYISQHSAVDGDEPVLPPDPTLEAMVQRIASLAGDRKAEDVVAFDLRGASAFSDAFVICSGRTDRQVKAIHDSIYDRFNEYIMTSLRTMWGTDLSKIEADFGRHFYEDMCKNIQPFTERKWLVHENNKLILTEQGKLFADHIASELFLSEEDHLR